MPALIKLADKSTNKLFIRDVKKYIKSTQYESETYKRRKYGRKSI